MALDFPNSPNVGDTYTGGSGTWKWDGTKWESGTSASSYLLLTGGALAGPGNLSVAGTLNVTGTTTLGALNVTGAATVAGNITGNNQIIVSGANAGFQFNDRNTAGAYWTWYAASNVARLFWNGYGDFLTIDTGGSLHAVGNITAGAALTAGNGYINAGPGTFYPPGDGWLYYNSSFRCWDFQSSNNISCPGSLFLNGCQMYNNSGFLYTPQSFYANGWISSANVFYVGGTGGPYWQNNGGWMYCPQGVWCSNINTGPIQLNGNNINGGSIYYSNGTAYGGWGCQYNWTGNGNWTSFQLSDLLYTYNNQGFAGGVYWTYCDERLKWNFRPVTRDCLGAINAIELKGFDFSEGHPRQRRTNPKETDPELFRWENLPRIVKHIETGFIAQQLREIIPEAVPDPPEEGAFLSVDMRPMVATLIGALQQVTKRLEALEGK